MKKYLILFLCAILILSMVACESGANDGMDSTQNTNDVQNATINDFEQEETAGSGDESSEIEFVDVIKIDSSKNKFLQDEGLTTFATFQETTIFKNDNYELIAKNIEYFDAYCAVNFVFINNTDQEADCNTEVFAVNDWMMSSTMNDYAWDVAPQSEAEFSWDIKYGQFKTRHIDVINSFSALFYINSERTEILTWKTDSEKQSKEYAFEGTVVYDKNDMKAIIPTNGAFGSGISYYAENNTNEIMYMDSYGSRLNTHLSETHKTWGDMAFPHTKVIPELIIGSTGHSGSKMKQGDVIEFKMQPSNADMNDKYLSSEVRPDLEGSWYKLEIQ